MDTGILPEHLACSSPQFGILAKAETLVRREYEPANKKTEEFVVEFLEELGVSTTGKKVRLKYVRCISDFICAAQSSQTGTISWLSGSVEYSREPYGREVAMKVKKALEKAGKLELVQKASKKDGLGRVFKVVDLKLPDFLRFKKHGIGPLVEVRSTKERLDGKIVGGKRLGRRKFEPELTASEQVVKTICAAMLQEPLQTPSGDAFVRCTRVFNNGSLKAGGRLYGPWQRYGEADRLKMTIGGEPVCEIDIKASYLSIANAKGGGGAMLPEDPYRVIPFVQDESQDPKLKRSAAKMLVNAYLCKEGDLKQMPKGNKDKETGRTVPFREKYKLPHPVGFYMEQIHKTFPFLKVAKEAGVSFMYVESQVIIGAMLSLLSQGVVSYPVHDCLIVKLNDKDRAIGALQQSMKDVLDYVPNMDVTYLIEDGEMVSEIIAGAGRKSDFEKQLGYFTDLLDCRLKESNYYSEGSVAEFHYLFKDISSSLSSTSTHLT